MTQTQRDAAIDAVKRKELPLPLRAKEISEISEIRSNNMTLAELNKLLPSEITCAEQAWGQIQSVEELLPGVLRITGIAHGGLLLSESRNESIPAESRLSRLYEEDVDAAIVYSTFENELSWPEFIN